MCASAYTDLTRRTTLLSCPRERAGAERGVESVWYVRTQAVPRATGEVAHFTFEELCLQPLGAADYMALAAAFRTVFLVDVPAMSRHTRDQARRCVRACALRSPLSLGSSP